MKTGYFCAAGDRLLQRRLSLASELAVVWLAIRQQAQLAELSDVDRPGIKRSGPGVRNLSQSFAAVTTSNQVFFNALSLLL